MNLSWIDEQEDDLLRGLVASLKTHSAEEWDALWREVTRQSEAMTEWELMPTSSIEMKFSLFWELIGPFAESAAEKLPNIGALEYGQRKRELQVGCVRGLRRFDVQKRSTVSRWLQVAWQYQDDNIRQRKGQQAWMTPSVVKNKKGEMTSRIEMLPDAEVGPLQTVEQKDLVGSVQKFYEERTPSYPWQTAVAVWLHDGTLLEEPEKFPAYLPRARQQLMRELTCGPLPNQTMPEYAARTSVFFRRHLWKRLSEVFENTVSVRK